MSSKSLHLVFLYGTLKLGQPNRPYLEQVSGGFTKVLGLARLQQAYPLVIDTPSNLPFLLDQPGVGKVCLYVCAMIAVRIFAFF